MVKTKCHALTVQLKDVKAEQLISDAVNTAKVRKRWREER